MNDFNINMITFVKFATLTEKSPLFTCDDE